jgi:hypothetical protein
MRGPLPLFNTKINQSIKKEQQEYGGSCKTQETMSKAHRDWLSAGNTVRALCPPPLVKLLARATPKGLEGVKCEAAASQRFLEFYNSLYVKT